MNKDKLIKSIETSRYILKLMESKKNSKYYILYGSQFYSPEKFFASENLKDLDIACKLFDMKADELEGN